MTATITKASVDLTTRIERAFPVLVTDEGLRGLQSLIQRARVERQPGRIQHLHGIEARVIEYRDYMRIAGSSDSLTTRAEYEQKAASARQQCIERIRVRHGEGGTEAPLPAALDAIASADPSNAYTPPVTPDDAPEEEDHHATPLSCTPEVKAAAARCHAARSKRGLANDETSMKAALMQLTGKFTTSRADWDAADYDELTREINAGTFVPNGISSWQRVLFRTKQQVVDLAA